MGCERDVSGLWVGVGALVCGSGPGVCAVVCGSVQVYVGVHGCAEVWVGGMNFQNIFWRLES